MKNQKFVRWTACALLALGAIYIGLIVWGIITQDPKTGFIRENVKILMEIATMSSATILLFFALSIKSILGPNNLLAEISVVFMAILVALTSIVHFVSITISDQLINTAPLLSPLLSLDWPSLLLDIDILAWDVFYGIAFIFLGLSIRQINGLSLVSIMMILSGILSLLGLIALPLNNMNLRYIGVFGYTVMPVISCAVFLGKIKKFKNLS
jgi:hypothetical protein